MYDCDCGRAPRDVGYAPPPAPGVLRETPCKEQWLARRSTLHLVRDSTAGFSRRRAGSGFRYVNARGGAIRDSGTIARIRALAIPPAWTDVWICPSPSGHIQATGRDARGRKQYRYHAKYRARRERSKYDRLTDFGRALPRIRARVRADLARDGLPREKVLAAVVQLLATTFVRVGNDEYVRSNGSYGLATLRDRHASVRGRTLTLRFRGKGGREHAVRVDSPRVARIVRRCRDLAGQRLFQYVGDDGQARALGSADVNAYLSEIGGEEFTAKDFRTWGGTLTAAHELETAMHSARGRRILGRVVDAAADALGNTPAICRKSYIHPGVLAACTDEAARNRWLHASRHPARAAGLSRQERALLRFLEGEH
jgi:DNA topoisomerase-1